MKQHLILLLTAVLLAVGCIGDEIDDTSVVEPAVESTDTLTLSVQSLSIDQAGMTAEITVNANVDWKTSVPVNWITLSAESGRSGSTALTVTVPANDSYARASSVTFLSESSQVALGISQKGALGGAAFSFGDADTSDDNIANTTFDRVIAIAFGGSQATVSGDVNGIVSVDGNRVTVRNSTKEVIVYDLSGSAGDGCFKLYSDKKQAVRLNGLNLTNTLGAPVNNQSKKRTFVIVEGKNTLADGSSYSSTPAGEDEKAAFFSEGQLVFCGTGSLDVTAKGKAGITSDDYVRFMSSPTVTVTSSAGHAVRGKDAVIVTAGTVNATASADMKKGFSSDSLVRFEGGSTVINVTGSAAYDSEDASFSGSAGIKADKLFEMVAGSLTVTNSGTGGKGISGDGAGVFQGGTVKVTTKGANYGQSNGGGFGPGGRPGMGSSSSNDNSVAAKGIKFDGNLVFQGGTVSVTCQSHEGIESKGAITVAGGCVYSYSYDDAINASGDLTISGGYVCAISTRNDGLDANGNCIIKGGVVYAVGSGSPEVAIDANTEGGKRLYVQGGTIVAFGGLENGSELSQACYSASSWNKGTWYALYSGSDPVLVFTGPSAAGSGLVVSTAGTPSLKSGVSVSGGTSLFGGIAVSGGTVSGGSSVKLSAYTGSGGFGPR